MKFDVVVVGGSIGGYFLVKELRDKGFAGSICLVDQGDQLPYNRYKLSKDWLRGDREDPPLFKKQQFYDEQEIVVKLKTKVVAVNAAEHQVVTENGDVISYGRLVLALGSSARHLTVPNQDAAGIFYLRSFDDALRIKKWSLQPEVKELVLVGAGFIGLELASTFTARGLQVTVVEYAKAPLANIAGPDAAQYLLELHRAHGVKLITGDGVAAFEKNRQGQIETMVTTSGKKIPAQMVIVGVGAQPNVAISAPGLKVDQQIVVNEYGETSLPDVFAVGDCTTWPYQGQLIHVEHWENARNQGKNVARNIINTHSEPYAIRPYFWTDQYDQTIEYLGQAKQWDHILTRGEVNTGKFTLAYVDAQNRPLAVLFANDNDKRSDVAKFMDEFKPIAVEKFVNLDLSLSEL
ncbi:NAD(P)/FAD-dependent oxidoreductase [Lapidilactobacillus bayanensis]|uniref:NAD(P)/FAD-dependent oxidoreductase n=1 Tax=Lapidilactobacillus bayanensis TaxID=2485998 RepID=UPI0013DE37CB|nr:FAD-dependent oxidoreductase [Lapidilactobacillus bayanensis]